MQPSRGSADIVKSLTVGSLFAGIGGFDLGFERAGFEIKWQVEIDPFCRAVLEKHWPHVGRYEDVRRCKGMARSTHAEAGDTDFGPESDTWEDRGWPTPNGVEPPDRPNELEYVDVICGGFPCQDISSAGAKAGLDGEQSGLWFEMSRIVRELRPRYVVVENVADLLARGLGRVLGDLAESGYDAEWDCIQAAAIGAPHGRDRLWLIAYPNTDQGGCEVSRQRDGEALQIASDRHPRRHDAHGLRSDVPNAGGTSEQTWSRRWTRQGFDFERWRSDARQRAGWETEPEIRRVADGVSPGLDNARLAALGNSILPQIAEWIAHRIKEAEGAVTGTADSSSMEPATRIRSAAPWSSSNSSPPVGLVMVN
jgi:DNA (cytosine-5)-methyltransferase 1